MGATAGAVKLITDRDQGRGATAHRTAPLEIDRVGTPEPLRLETVTYVERVARAMREAVVDRCDIPSAPTASRPPTWRFRRDAAGRLHHPAHHPGLGYEPQTTT